MDHFTLFIRYIPQVKYVIIINDEIDKFLKDF